MALAITGGLLVALPASAQEHTIFDNVKLEVVPETHGVAPYPNELVLVHIRGLYRPLINIQHMQQPELTDFGWMHLTKDKLSESTFDGFPAVAYERVIAVYPEKSGPLEIGSFTHKLTVVDGAGNREIDVKSAPVTVQVAQWQGPGGPGDPNSWWLPASDVTVADTWAADPNHVPRGETIQRTVTIEAYGVTAEQLPPPPVMRSAGIISFRGPTDRETRVTENGPVARAVYRWNMRPISAFPATVEAIKIPWFDTVSRSMREATIPAQRMAWDVAGAPSGDAAAIAGPKRPPLGLTLGVGASAFLLGVALLLVGTGGLRALPGLPPRALHKLNTAAWRGDAASVRAAVTELVRKEPERSEAWVGRAEVRAGLAELDRHLYGGGQSPRPNLRRLARIIVTARRAAGGPARSTGSGLAPLDGPLRNA